MRFAASSAIMNRGPGWRLGTMSFQVRESNDDVSGSFDLSEYDFDDEDEIDEEWLGLLKIKRFYVVRWLRVGKFLFID